MKIPKGLFYPRADPDQAADLLIALADVLRQTGWEERGGHLLRDSNGEVCGRTKWIPRSGWWAERPFPFSERQCAGIVLKQLRGDRLSQRESDCMRHLLQVAGIWDAPMLTRSNATRASNEAWLKENQT